MGRFLIIRWLLIVVLAWAPNSQILGQSSGQHTSTASTAPAKLQGFLDYALGKINPRGTDYGASLQDGRANVVGGTVDDLYFWSNVFSLLLLTAAATIMLLQWQAADKRELIAASLIAQLWNSRISDRIEIARRTEQFNRLVATHNAETERALMLKAQSSEGKGADEVLSRSVRKLTDKSGAGVPPKDTAQLRLKMDTVAAGDLSDVQQSSLLLQRRVEALQNSEANLKQRLNQTTVLLDQERRRNSTLKGA